MDVFKKKIRKLLIKVSKNDKKALEELFLETKEFLYTIAIKYLFDKSKAEDIVSEVFLKIVDKIDTFDKSKEALPWMVQICKNQCIDQNRRDSYRFTERLDETTYVYEGDQGKKNSPIWMALKTLSKIEYDIVTLRIIERYKLDQLAKELKIPRTKVYRIYEEAIAKLKKILEEGD